MLGAVDLGVTNDGERADREQAAQTRTASATSSPDGLLVAIGPPS
jgi:hypothetical protein